MSGDLKGIKALAIGEVLWDIFPDDHRLGGAPFNVVAHLQKMGAEAYLLSAVGYDELGEKIVKEAQSLGVNTRFLGQTNDYPTGTVKVSLEAGIPSYTIVEGVAWDFLTQTSSTAAGLLEEPWDVVIFGTLAQRAPANGAFIRATLDSLEATEIFFDVNLRQDYYSREAIIQSLEKCSILKLNDEEVDVLSRVLFEHGMSSRAFVEKLFERYALHTVCVTLGGDGAEIHTRERIDLIPGVSVSVRDTVGAGDSFSAAYLWSWLHGGDPVEAGKTGCRLGAYVASKDGAIPEYDSEIRAVLSGITGPDPSTA